MTTHSSILWKSPTDRGTRRATVHRVERVRRSWARQKVMEWGAVSPWKQRLSWGKAIRINSFGAVIRHNTQESAWRKAMLLNLSCYGTLCQVTHADPWEKGPEEAVTTHSKEYRSCKNSWGKWPQKWKTAALRQQLQILRRGRIWFPELPSYNTQQPVLNRSQTISRNQK